MLLLIYKGGANIMKKYFTYQWHITDSCDQRCKHCYIFSKENKNEMYELNLDELSAILNNCIDMCERLDRSPYLSITGGDPLLHKNFWDFAKLLKEKNIPFNILGNPFHLDNDVCKKLHEYGCNKYQLSIDGVESTHDFIRKKGSFQCTLSKIPVLKNAGIKCAIMTTVSKTNIKEIPSIIDIVVENEADVFAFARYCPVNGEQDLLVSPEEYRNLLNDCWEKYNKFRESQTSFNLKDHLWTLFLYEKGLFKIDETLDKETIYEGCACGIGHLTILSDGTVYACRRMDSPIGNALTDSLYDVFLSSKMDEYRKYEEFEKCSKCGLLRFCRGCPAVSFGAKGSMYAADPQCWKVIDE